MGSLTPTIAYFGSCRVATPLRLLAKTGLVDLETGRNYGFVHSVPEILQIDRFAFDDIAPDPSLSALFSPKADLKDLAKNPTYNPDILVLELSSNKTFWIGDTPVQSNYLNSFFEDHLSDQALSELRYALSKGMVAAFLTKHGKTLGAPHRTLLEKITKTSMDQSAITAALSSLKRRANQLVIVPHIDAVTQDGSTLPSRQEFRGQVITAAQSLGIDVFDPTTLLEQVGQSQSIEDNSTGLAHYTMPFSKLWGFSFAERFLQTCPLPKPSLHPSGSNGNIPTRSKITRCQAKSILNQKGSSTKELSAILNNGDHIPPDILADAARRCPEIPLPHNWSAQRKSAVLAHLSVQELSHRLELGQTIEFSKFDLMRLWGDFITTDPNPQTRYYVLSVLAQYTPLPQKLLSFEIRALRRIAKANVEAGDLDLAIWLTRLRIPGLDLPAEVHLYCARLAYFQEDWPLCVEQGLIALRLLPENRGGWIRLGRAATALGLTEVETHVQKHLAQLDRHAS